MKFPIQSVPIDRVDVWSPNRSNFFAGVNPSDYYRGYGANCDVGSHLTQGATRDAVCSDPRVTHYRHVTEEYKHNKLIRLTGGSDKKNEVHGGCTACSPQMPSKGTPMTKTGLNQALGFGIY
ncbi:MAG: hypothetical protein Kow00121_19930 [Elainellaceae cyanobacterium]